MRVLDEIHKRQKGFTNICTSLSVKSIYAFGSSTNDQFNENTSDIDLVVEIAESDPLLRSEKLLALWDQLESFFRRKVDLLTEVSITNPVLRKSIESTKIKVYDRERPEIFI